MFFLSVMTNHDRIARRIKYIKLYHRKLIYYISKQYVKLTKLAVP